MPYRARDLMNAPERIRALGLVRLDYFRLDEVNLYQEVHINVYVFLKVTINFTR